VRRFVPFLLRDLVVTAAMVAVAMLDARTRAGGASGLGPMVLGVLTGVLVTVAAFLVHEWGHLTGALGSGGIVEAPRSLVSVFLFEFDEKASTRRQFLAMSYGGYLASIVAVILIALWIDLGTAGGLTTAVLAGSGIAATFALEMPKTWKAYRSG
jgi:hypothetical protein